MKKTTLLLILLLVITSGCSGEKLKAVYEVPSYWTKSSIGNLLPVPVTIYINKSSYPKKPVPQTILIKGRKCQIEGSEMIQNNEEFWVFTFKLAREFVFDDIFDRPGQVKVTFLDENGKTFTLKAEMEPNVEYIIIPGGAGK
ncbi:MAG: hypothetical protein HZA49_08210 [Planctomycetes bacterium]|nr:hypothetical protein [Planctomycetota bacterium]